MTETINNPASVEPVVAPVATSEPVVASAPVVEPAKIETVLNAPVSGSTPVVEPVKVETKVEPPKEPEKVVEPTQEVKVEEKAQSDEPAPAPIYDPFKLPDNIKLDADRVKQFTDILADLETKGKVEHALAQEFGQKAVDLYLNEVNKTVEDLQKFYQTTWDKQKTDWKEEFLKDPDLGGNRSQTTVDSANNFIRTHGGTEEQQKEFRQLMETSGLGNHKAMIRLLANAGREMSEGRPLAAPAPATQPKSKVETLYGKSK